MKYINRDHLRTVPHWRVKLTKSVRDVDLTKDVVARHASMRRWCAVLMRDATAGRVSDIDGTRQRRKVCGLAIRKYPDST